MDSLGLMDLLEHYNPTSEEYIFFSSTSRIFMKIGHIMGLLASCNILPRISSI